MIRRSFPSLHPQLSVISPALQELAVAKVQYQKKQEEIKREQEENAKKEAVGILVKSRDEMREIDWYHDPRTQRTDNQRAIYAYIGKKDGNVWLRFRMSYSGPDWLFVKAVLFKVDGENFELRSGLLDDWSRDHAGGSIWEWKDMSVDAYIWNLINKIAKSNRTLLRYEGQQYFFDRELDSTGRAALKRVLSAYENMGGKPPSK